MNFLGGDPDKPVIVGQLYNEVGEPAGLSNAGNLPGNRYLSGIKSREIVGRRGNQLQLDDTEGEISAQLSSDHGASQVSLGFLTSPRTAGVGSPKGEGIELVSDEQVAIRSAKGILVTAWQHAAGADKQMARQEFLTLIEECSDLVKSLGDYALRHYGKGVESTELGLLHTGFTSWENGSNTAPGATDGGMPLIALTAPAGISFATPRALVSYAGTTSSIVSQKNIHVTAGQRATVHAGRGLSMFSQSDGIEMIAHKGKLLIQSQKNETEINSARNMKLTATEGNIIGVAKEIVLVSEDGSFIRIGNGITLGTAGTITHHGSSFPFKGGSTMAAELPKFEGEAGDQKFQARYYPHLDGGIPAPGLNIISNVGDNSIEESDSDSDGKSVLIQRDAMYTISAKAIKK